MHELHRKSEHELAETQQKLQEAKKARDDMTDKLMSMQKDSQAVAEQKLSDQLHHIREEAKLDLERIRRESIETHQVRYPTKM